MDSFVPKSSFIAKAEYDDQNHTMTLSFKEGSTYKYLYVFPATWTSFKESPDHSSYYSRAIKGKLNAVPLIKKTIGHKQSSPLKAKQVRKPRNGNIFTAGTVTRALRAAEGRQEPSQKPIS